VMCARSASSPASCSRRSQPFIGVVLPTHTSRRRPSPGSPHGGGNGLVVPARGRLVAAVASAASVIRWPPVGGVMGPGGSGRARRRWRSPSGGGCGRAVHTGFQSGQRGSLSTTREPMNPAPPVTSTRRPASWLPCAGNRAGDVMDTPLFLCFGKRGGARGRRA
jgi:hypothetical protein